MPVYFLGQNIVSGRQDQGSVVSNVIGLFDPDAQAFITAASISDETQQGAINQLVLDLKGASIWDKFDALYPFVGGTASSHSYNLKNPSLYQIAWGGAVTHNANGITGDGSSGYGDTGLSASSLDATDCHMAGYSREILPSAGTEICARNSDTGDCFDLWMCDGPSRFVARAFNGTLLITGISPGGLFASTRSGTTHTGYRNSEVVGPDTSTANPSSNIPLNINILCDYSQAGRGAFSSKNLAFVSIGDGLTLSNYNALLSAVQAFQTALSRAV